MDLFANQRKLHEQERSGVARQTGARALVAEPAPLAEGTVVIQTRPVDAETGEAGDWETRYEDHNLVVSQAEGLMAQMAIGATNSNIGYIELGNPVGPTAPQVTDVTLESTTNERQPVTAVVNGSQAEFTAVWGTGDGNGFTFTESGLFTDPFGSGSMFARKTGFSIAKTISFEMRFVWILKFTVTTGAGGAECASVALTGPGTVAETFEFPATGGETEVLVPIDFIIGANHLDVFLNGQRLHDLTHYSESLVTGGKGIILTAPLTAEPDDVFYFVHRRIF